MSIHAHEVNSWRQAALFAHGPVEVELKFGLIPEADHGQVLLSSCEAGGGELLSMESVHHFTASELDAVIDDFTQRLRNLVEHHFGPF